MLDNLPTVFQNGDMIKDIVISYLEEQPLYEEIKQDHPHVHFIKGYTDEVEHILSDPKRPGLLFVDDQMESMTNSSQFLEMFLRKSHHLNVNCVLVVHNMFFGSKHMRSISLSATGLMIFKNPRDLSSISHLARQLMPTNSHFLVAAYKLAVSKPYIPFFVDLAPRTQDTLRFRSGVNTSEQIVLYTPSNIHHS